ncbi:MAG: hypothetical protein R6V05_02265 [Candidatus Brocadiia bacterium]
MRIAAVAIVVLVVVVGAVLLLGGGGEGPGVQQTEPFAAAIAEYLSDNNMGMKVAEFESLDVGSAKATATCKMQEASGLYEGMAVRWQFTFRRGDGGQWQVVEHEKP